jgi:murein DD-endopeptidase MepM/ murein hydrolase activator NlpD
MTRSPDTHPDTGTVAPLAISRRAALRGVMGGAFVAACGCVLGSGRTGAAAPITAQSLAAAATATERADRKEPLRQIGSLMFPMGPRPRCNVLDNFGDARSGGRRHEGIDILATEGQDIYTVSDGEIVSVAEATGPASSLSGNAWGILAPDNTYYFYAHLSRFAEGLERGDRVTKGQVIGYVGDTGNPGVGNFHLHFEVHPGGQNRPAVDPLPLLSIPAVCNVW